MIKLEKLTLIAIKYVWSKNSHEILQKMLYQKTYKIEKKFEKHKNIFLVN